VIGGASPSGDRRDHGCECVAAVWITGQRLHMGDELATFAAFGFIVHPSASIKRRESQLPIQGNPAFDFARIDRQSLNFWRNAEHYYRSMSAN
jgi:hypothetical protein